MIEYREIYCKDCKKTLGRYNIKYYSEVRIAEIIRTSHALHVRGGHNVEQRRVRE